ncbi:MAG: hypothetical protein AAFV53_36055 [Myxococcota bacterium]
MRSIRLGVLLFVLLGCGPKGAEPLATKGPMGHTAQSDFIQEALSEMNALQRQLRTLERSVPSPEASRCLDVQRDLFKALHLVVIDAAEVHAKADGTEASERAFRKAALALNKSRQTVTAAGRCHG